MKSKIEDPGNYRPLRLTLFPRNVIEQVILETFSNNIENKKVMGSSLHGFMKGKLLFANSIAFWFGG